ncbi:MAG TPA: glycine cleavage system aminomethyltransferase GcvT [Thermoplasmata archaeon]|nr:glycine cleavage system aminomethyltransferase GcvT [Thermoplasmata archaeon]
MSEAEPAPSAPLRETPLHPFHVARRAHMVPFNGWEMPLYFDGIIPEHRAVREGAGFFDVGHMGIVSVSGEHGSDLLSRRTTANAAKIAPGQCHYSFLTEFNGAILDDLLITHLDGGDAHARQFLVVPNAGRATKVVELLTEHRRPDTTIVLHNGAVTILAVQGPRSREILESVFGWKLDGLKFYTSRFFPSGPGSPIPAEGVVGLRFPQALDSSIFVSRTGYTGELGYELFVPGTDAVALAGRLVAAGVVPCGLGARDTLRMEKGYLLSGQDFNRDRTPLEAAQERFVDLDHPFVGRDALEAQAKEGVKVRFAGLLVDEPGAIPRHGTPIHHGADVVASATSGGHSPTLQKGIALAYLPRPLDAPGTELSLELRGRSVPARVVPLPFLAAAKERRGYTPRPP